MVPNFILNKALAVHPFLLKMTKIFSVQLLLTITY